MKRGPKSQFVETLEQIASRWGVAVSTVQHWRRAGWCNGDDMELARHLSQRAKNPVVKAKARSVLAGVPLVEAPKPVDIMQVVQSAADSDIVDRNLATGAIDFVKDLNGDYNRTRAMAKVASDKGDFALSAELEERSHRIGKLIPEIMAKLRKIGEDRGEKISKTEATRIFSAWVNAIVVGMSKLRTDIRDVTAKHGVELEVALEIENAMTLRVLLTPAITMTQVQSVVSLPTWVGEIVRKSVEEELEGGANFWNAMVEQLMIEETKTV